jgi:hypothetical protein
MLRLDRHYLAQALTECTYGQEQPEERSPGLNDGRQLNIRRPVVR